MVYQAINMPDPDFVSEMMQMPDPKPEDLEKILTALPILHKFFLRKKSAYKNRDTKEFQKVLEEEIDYLKDFDAMSLRY